MNRIRMGTLPCMWLQEWGSRTLCRHYWGQGQSKLQIEGGRHLWRCLGIRIAQNS